MVAVLMLAAPLAGASSTITFTAPYTNLAKMVNYGVSSYGCHAYASTPVTPGVTQSTATIWGEVHAVSGSCGAGYTSGSGWFDLGFQGFKFKAPTGGFATVTVTWALNWSVRASVNSPSGGNTSVASGVNLEWFVYLVDMNNGAAYPTNNSTTFVQLVSTLLTTSGTWFAHSHGATYSITGTWVVTPGDSIEVATMVDASAYDYSDGTGGLAWSEVNLGTPGLGGNIASVTIS